ncbi:carboxymuconolactone decarboxylase family protein [Paenibacillus sp. PR3]|uniref:Carboxymuconolactone decarboxylase family protein n=1 Tax=Paenibacillus terricola TaxID=2763503 RepID=A0ABR8MYL7_9BACL|nr:carboxymuconolactone decarboxylase family protein [Paenibacillus terricola]MBD3921043.1 carboxymuconolactone decarboxylase family protein [Paenibacillus terricola]
MNGSLYKRSNLARISELQKLVPEGAKSYFKLEHTAFESKLLSMREKELIAAAVAHVTGCPYCIDVHAGKLKKQDGSMNELAEAILVASAVNAESVLNHGANAILTMKGDPADSLYSMTNLEHFNELRAQAPAAFTAYDRFADVVFAQGVVEPKVKGLIAVAAAHVLGCAYSIARYVKHYHELGGTREEMAEALLVAGVVNAGLVLSHGVNALEAFDAAESETSEIL